jgi:sugar O-acyltransferase (sialic acid O-acetyltransferase NeuD family)
MSSPIPIIIIGAGGHGAEIDDYIRYYNTVSGDQKIKVIGFLDDNPNNYHAYQFSAPLLGAIKDHVIRKDCFYMIGIANLLYRRLFVERFLAQGASFHGFIHPTAYISPSVKMGQGVVIGPHVNLGPNTVVGDFSMINSRCSLGHDTKIGKYNFISPNVCFSGFTRVGSGNLFGINSVTIPGIKVGDNNKIMAGMVLDKNVGDDEVVFYRFKEKVIAVSK